MILVEQWNAISGGRRVRVILAKGPALKAGGNAWTVAISGAAMSLVDCRDEGFARRLFGEAKEAAAAGDFGLLDRRRGESIRDSELVVMPDYGEMVAFWGKHILKGDAQALADPRWVEFRRRFVAMAEEPMINEQRRAAKDLEARRRARKGRAFGEEVGP